MSDKKSGKREKTPHLLRRRILQISGGTAFSGLLYDDVVGQAAATDDGADGNLRVQLCGPTNVGPGEETYTARVEGGQGDLDFDWNAFVLPDGWDVPVDADGNTAEISFGWNSEHGVAVEVEDDETSASDAITVDVQNDPGPPNNPCDGTSDPMPVDVGLVGRDWLKVGHEFEFQAIPDDDDATLEYEWSVEDAGSHEYDISGEGDTISVTFYTEGEFTLRVDYETDAGYESDATTTFEVVDLQPYVDAKAGTIDEIRNHAAAMNHIGGGEADARVDQKAEALLEDIEDCVFDTRPDQYEEALKRMDAAEGVTSAATEAVTGQETIFGRIIDSIINFVTGAALELVPISGTGILRKVNKSIVRDAARTADRASESLRGKGVSVPVTPSRRINRIISDSKERRADTIEEWAVNNPDDADEILDEIVKDIPLDIVLGIGSSLVSQLDAVDDAKTDLEEEFFEMYYFGSQFGDTDILDPEELDLPSKELTYEIPIDDLPWYIADPLPTDGITIEVDPEDFGFHTPPEIDDLEDVIDQLDDQAPETEVEDISINGYIDREMDALRDEIGSLEQTDDDVRDIVETVISQGIETIDDVVEQCLEFLDWTSLGLSIVSVLFTIGFVLAILAAVLSAKTGIGPAVSLAFAMKLLTIGTVISYVSLYLELLQAKVGIGYLGMINGSHQMGTSGLTRTNLGGLDL